MSAVISLYNLFGINQKNFSKQELMLLEAILFQKIYQHFKQQYQLKNKSYFYLMKLNKEQEEAMVNSQCIRSIMHEMIITETYTLEGIARYTDTCFELVESIYRGYCSSLPSHFLYRLIELDYSTRKQLYKTILKKIILDDDK